MPGVNEGLGAGEKCGYKKANMRDLCGDQTVLYLDRWWPHESTHVMKSYRIKHTHTHTLTEWILKLVNSE